MNIEVLGGPRGDLPPMNALQRDEQRQTWKPGAVLFQENDRPSGIYIIHSGMIDLRYSTREGVTKALQRATSGDILGLSSVLSGRPLDCSAIARTRCVTGFVSADAFRRLLEERPSVWFQVLQFLSRDLNACWDYMRSGAGR